MSGAGAHAPLPVSSIPDGHAPVEPVEQGATEAAIFGTIWEISSDAMAVSDRDGKILRVNPAYCALFGRSADQFVGQSFTIIFPEAARPNADAAYRDIFERDGLPDRFEAVARHADGRDLLVESRIAFIVRRGERIAMLSVIRDHSQLRRTEAALALVQERERIAMELHDGPLQTLHAVLLRLDVTRRAPPASPEALAAVIGGLASDLRGAVGEIRQMIADPSPESGPGSLADALRALAVRLQGSTGALVACAIGPRAASIALPPFDQAHVLRVAQEAGANAVRHGRAARIDLSLDVRRGALVLVVEDDGVGFEQSARHRAGFGLRGMTERARRAGGRLSIHSQPGRGTRVRLRVPLARPD